MHYQSSAATTVQARKQAQYAGTRDRNAGRALDARQAQHPVTGAAYRAAFEGRAWQRPEYPPQARQAPIVNVTTETPYVPPAWAVDADGEQAERVYEWQTR